MFSLRARNPSAMAMDLWVIPQRDDIKGVTGISRGAVPDELGVMENYDGDYAFYIWNVPIAGDVTQGQAQARNPSALALDAWQIPAGNNTVDMAAPGS